MPLRITTGPAIERAGDLVAILTSLGPGEVLFIDEIHRIARPAEELLYSAMEDFRVDVVLGKGPGATAIPLDVAPFTLVGATTRAGLLTGPMHDRFGFVGHLDFYDQAELERVLTRTAPPARRPAHHATARPRSRAAPAARRASPTGCCAGCGTTPRSGPPASSPARSPRPRCASSTSTSVGLDRLDRAVLTALVRTSAAGPVGLATLAVAVGEEAEDGRGGRRALPCSAPGCWPAPPAAGWPRPRPSSTSGSSRRCARRRRGAWRSPPVRSRRAICPRCSTDASGVASTRHRRLPGADSFSA